MQCLNDRIIGFNQKMSGKVPYFVGFDQYCKSLDIFDDKKRHLKKEMFKIENSIL
jgi:hypothetical protein